MAIMACDECTMMSKMLAEANSKATYLEHMLSKRERVETETAVLNKILQAQLSNYRQSTLEDTIEHK
jgi:hypothetical protein